ncbi:TRAP transporter large permease subunit [Chloroflexota bacterium]
MDWPFILLVIFGSLIILMLTGLPIAFCFLLIIIVGAFFIFGGGAGLRTIINNIYGSVTVFTLVAVPLFVFMGEVVFHSGIGLRTIGVLDQWLGRMPGRLGLLAVGSGTLFSAMSGSTMATTAMLGTILTPEMENRGYKKPMSLGPIMGSGGLAMMIPPSALGVLLASLAKISVGKLLIGGILPGLIMAFLYSGYIIARCWLQPSVAPPYEVSTIPFSKKIMPFVKYVLPLGLIVFLVIGLIFLGVATPSEAAALGVLGCFLLAAVYGGLNWQVIKTSTLGALRVTIMVFMIIIGSITFSQLMAFSGASAGLLQTVTGMTVPPIVLLIGMQLILLFLGCFMDNLSIMMITIPIYIPIIQTLGWDPIWFAVIMLVNVETGLITPPFGLSLFVMKGVAGADTTMADVYKAGLPFFICNLIAMAVIIAFPVIALWLPGMMQ